MNDQETMPYQVGLRLDNQYKVYNFGVHGYGPQHMLALLESGKVGSTVVQTPDFAIYQALYPEHVYRAAGLRFWVRTGPKYVLDSNGDALLSGSFSDDDSKQPWVFIRRQMAKSALGRHLLRYTRPIGSSDDKLFVAIILKAARLLKQLNPRIDFHVLIWGEPPVAVVSELKDADISVHSADSILQAGNTTDTDLKIMLDEHPTRIAHALIADRVVQMILKNVTSGE